MDRGANKTCPHCSGPMYRVPSQAEVECGAVEDSDPTYPPSLLPGKPQWCCDICGKVIEADDATRN